MLLLLFAALTAVIVWAYIKGPKTNVLLLKTWPTSAWLGAQILLSFITKPNKDRIAAIARVPKIQVAIQDAQPFQLDRLQRFLVLAGFARGAQPDISTLPLMYPIVESFKMFIQAMLMPGFPFKVLGSVLARNTTVVYRALRPDDKLLYSVRIEPSSWRTTAKGDTEVDVVCEGASPLDAQLVWSSTTTAIILNPKRQRGNASSEQVPAPPSWQVIDSWQLGINTGVQYGSLNGDLNPIHVPMLSRLFGFKRPIAHALFLVAKAEASLKTAGIQAPGYPVTLMAEFKRPTLLPAVLKLGIEAKPGGEFAARLAEKGSRVQFAVLTEDGSKEVLTGSLINGTR